MGLELDVMRMDVRDGGEVARTVSWVEEERGPVDVLVNSAGYGLWGPVETYSVDEIRAQFETNLFGVVRLIKAVAPGMVSRRRGVIVNVSSVLGRVATPFHSAYAASKFALEGLSESLRAELRPFGVRVVVVEPGVVRTGFQGNQVVAQGMSQGETVYSPYADTYWRRHARFESRGVDPAKVARVIHRAIRSRNPALRRPVGLDARAGTLGARLLPERLFQAILGRVTTG